jgi:hypothetical protein
MNSNSINLIKSMVSVFDGEGIDCIDRLGEKIDVLSSGVYKYKANDPDVTHFILFELNGENSEVSFFCEQCEFCITDIEEVFGGLQLHYNFRENYSEFKVNTPSKIVSGLYFIKNNKFEVSADGQFMETNPQGESICHSTLCFNGFCLRLKG